MGLFDFKNEKIIINPEAAIVPPFNEIWKRDKSKGKARATKEISYVYFLCDFKSPYAIYTDDEREDKVKEDFIKDDKWSPDPLISVAVDKYNELQETPSMRLLKMADVALRKMSKYIENFSPHELDDKGKPMYKIGDLNATVKSMGPAILSRDIIEKKVKEELADSSKIRGSVDIKSRER